VIGPGIDEGVFHHKNVAGFKRVFENGQYLVEHPADPVAARLEQLRNKNARAGRVRFPARPRSRYAKLPRDGGDLDAGEYGSGNDVPFCYSDLPRFDAPLALAVAAGTRTCGAALPA